MVEEMEAWWKEQDRQDRRVMRVHVALPGGSDGKASDYNAGDLGSIPGSGSSPGEGNGNPLQRSSLGNPMETTEQIHFETLNGKNISFSIVHLNKDA